MRDTEKHSYREKSPAMKRVEQMRKKRVQRERMMVGGAVVAVVIVAFAVACMVAGKKGTTAEAESSTVIETTFASDDIRVNGISLTGMTREEAKTAIAETFPWKVTVSYNGETLDADNILDAELDAFLDGICTVKAAGDYTFAVEDSETLRESAKAAAEKIAAVWDVKAKNSEIYDYDAANDKFLFSEGTAGTEVNQEKLASALTDAALNGTYDAVIAVEADTVQPEYSEAEARARYEKLATFTTETTANEKRNTNVRLAAEAINGTIVKPGEEFSFNKIVGPRTAEKGFQEAAAYNSGEVVQELGGGVCQVSSTLYRVAFQSGMSITYRRSHTFEPNYVTPGQDAAISWDYPDFRFINTSDAAIGIRASYSDRKTTVAIYGVPVLEDGVTWSLESEKVEELPPPDPTYEEDSTLAPGTEVVKKAGTNGSRWITYKVVKKNGEVVERTEDHSKEYKGHAAVIRRNTGKIQTAGTSAAAKTTAAATVDGMPDGYVPGQKVAPESSAADKKNATEKNTAAEKSTASEKTTAAEKSTTAEKTTSAEKTTAAEKPASAEKTTAAEKTTSAEQPASSENTTAAETTAAQEGHAVDKPTAPEN